MKNTRIPRLDSRPLCLRLRLRPRLHLTCIPLATLILTACITLSAYADVPLTLRYTSKAESTQPYQANIWQGETVDLQCTLTAYGSALTLATNAAATLWYQTNGMDTVWWEGPATATTNGILTAHWSPSLDIGASSYTYYIGVGDTATNTLYRSYGIIRMANSPGYVPNSLDLPTHTLDFGTITVTNAPWATGADISTAIGDIVEADPAALPVATQALAIAQAALPVSYNSANKSYSVGGGKSLFLPASIESGVIGAMISSDAFYFSFDTREIGDVTAIYSTYLNQDGVYSAFADDCDEYHFGKGLWPDTYTDSPLIKRDELAATNALIHADMASTYATSNWVSSIRGIHADIASNVVYHVVVSNGHWLIQEVQ